MTWKFPPHVSWSHSVKKKKNGRMSCFYCTSATLHAIYQLDGHHKKSITFMLLLQKNDNKMKCSIFFLLECFTLYWNNSTWVRVEEYSYVYSWSVDLKSSHSNACKDSVCSHPGACLSAVRSFHGWEPASCPCVGVLCQQRPYDALQSSDWAI